MKTKKILWEIKYDGLTALIFAPTKKKAILFFEEKFEDFPADNWDPQWGREDWLDDRGFEITHLGNGSKDWTVDENALLISLDYRYQA